VHLADVARPVGEDRFHRRVVDDLVVGVEDFLGGDAFDFARLLVDLRDLHGEANRRVVLNSSQGDSLKTCRERRTRKKPVR
jgi:hypothetical protein